MGKRSDLKTLSMALLCVFIFTACSKVGLRSQSDGNSSATSSIFPNSLLSKDSVVANSYQGLWWNPSESGWGMTLTQHNSTIFIAIYTYDSAGNPDWYTMSNCSLDGNSCTGDIYHVVGGSSLTVAWQGQGLAVTSVGKGTLNFSDVNHAVFSFVINGVSGTKVIEKDIFAATSDQAINYSDMWWNEFESGWGLAVTHIGSTMFLAVYTYDLSGNPIWYVASNCNVVNNNECTSPLYKTSGGRNLTSLWNINKVGVNTVGSITLSFSDSEHGRMSFVIDGRSGEKAITRLSFGAPAIPDAPVPGPNYPMTIITSGNFAGTYNSYHEFALKVLNSGGGGACIQVDGVMAFGQGNFPPCFALQSQNPLAICKTSQPANDSQTVACQAGQAGSITQTRSYSCAGVNWVAGAWTTTSNTCVAPTPTTTPPQLPGSCLNPNLYSELVTSGANWRSFGISRGFSASFHMPAATSAGHLEDIVLFQTSGTPTGLTGEISISTCPGDFNVDARCKTWGTVDEGATRMTLVSVSAVTNDDHCQLVVGQNYFVNVRNVKFDRVTPSCDLAVCINAVQYSGDMFGP